jgi:hypothetical protein
LESIINEQSITVEEKISEINELIMSEGEGSQLSMRWLDIVGLAMEKVSLNQGFQAFYAALKGAIAAISGHRPTVAPDTKYDHNDSFLNESMEEKAIVVQVDKILSQAHSTQVVG